MKQLSWIFLFLWVFSVYAEDEDLPVVSSAKELKAVKAEKIIWKQDGSKMVLVLYSCCHGCDGDYYPHRRH